MAGEEPRGTLPRHLLEQEEPLKGNTQTIFSRCLTHTHTHTHTHTLTYAHTWFKALKLLYSFFTSILHYNEFILLTFKVMAIMFKLFSTPPNSQSNSLFLNINAHQVHICKSSFGTIHRDSERTES